MLALRQSHTSCPRYVPLPLPRCQLFFLDCLQLIKDLGFSSIDAQGLTVAPYVVGWFMVVIQSWHSDYTRDRGYHIMFSAALSTIGYIILATSVQKSVGAAYFALFLVVGGNYSLFPLVM
jgi:hypothetical protein